VECQAVEERIDGRHKEGFLCCTDNSHTYRWLNNHTYIQFVTWHFSVLLDRIILAHVSLANCMFGRFPECRAATWAPYFVFLPTDYEELLKCCTIINFCPVNRNGSKWLCNEQEKLCSRLVNLILHFTHSKNVWQLCQSTSLFLSPQAYKLGSSFSAHNFVHSSSLSGIRRYYLGCIANSPVTAVLNIT